MLSALPLLLLPLAAAADPARLLHRVFHPELPDLPFSQRASLHRTHSGQHYTVPAPSLHDHFASFAQALQAHDVTLNDALYQLALEHPGDQNSAQWHISSVKACHLARSTDESITLHLAADGTPFALDYFVGPIPRNGACPKKNPKGQADLFDLHPIANTTVIVRSPTFPPLPQLRAPPPLTPEGKVFEPPQEKSFIQKYWVYFAVAAVAILVTPSPPEEDKGGAKQ
ncbi:hypothetical protein BXZ70DRAFT_1004442 [Cristinia sonorae]|uniref:ER membrane protein complex subunit 10 n=1 Tax=Cristinia sonorae TaxID=1940300 RepID=A0A8K0UXK8_9AGAR|nr:hypothetical protein BXZ70DRAFT_1004442 [Cristinia sonorae]